MRRAFLQLMAAAPLGLWVGAEASEDEAARVQAIAQEAYVYGLPLVMNYAAMVSYVVDARSPQYKGGFNQLHHEARVYTPQDTAIVTPNSDTPYSLGWMDLRAEPQVLSVPAVDPQRYYSVMLCDSNTFNYGLFGSLTTGHQAGDYLVVGPHWQGQVPAGIRQVFRCGSALSLALVRTGLAGAQDMAAVQALQQGYRLRPLSAYLGRPAPAPAPALDFLPISKDTVQRNFFAYLDFALRLAPPGPEEQGVRQRLASLGIGQAEPDQLGRFKALAARHPQALLQGVQAGVAQVNQAAANGGQRRNGWLYPSLAGGDRAYYNGDWLRRAALAKMGLYGLNASEALYPMARTLADGTPLDGSQQRYRLRFAAGALPPVKAFWSLTMYHGQSQLLVDNPLGRYLINAAMLPSLQRDADGAITLYIQKESPGAALESNWLPAPAGPIFLVMRLFGPEAALNAQTWSIPALQLAPQPT